MKTLERPSPLQAVLDFGERAQQAIGRSRMAEMAVSAVAGSASPAYRQAAWLPRAGIQAVTMNETVVVHDNPYASRLPFPRLWDTAIIMGTPKDEFEALKQKFREAGDEPKDAVTYVSRGIPRIGILDSDEALFHEASNVIPGYSELKVGMRRGRQEFEAGMGVWLPGSRQYVGAKTLRLIAMVEPIDDFNDDFPGVLLT